MKSLVIILSLSAAVVLGQSSPAENPAKTTATKRAPKQGSSAKDGEQKDNFLEKFHVRNLPADQLRDFRGLCFGSTTFRFYRVGDSWPLHPFCGMATCATDGVHLMEQVTECRMPKDNPKCKIVNLNDREKTFPDCCPKFECEEGTKLEYPTPEEIQARAQQVQEAQFMRQQLERQQIIQQQQLQAGLHQQQGIQGIQGLPGLQQIPGGLAGLQHQQQLQAAAAGGPGLHPAGPGLAGLRHQQQLQAAAGLHHRQQMHAAAAAGLSNLGQQSSGPIRRG